MSDPNPISIDSVSWLQDRLRKAAQRHRLIETATFAITAVSLFILVLGLYFLCDFMLHFPSLLRVLLTVGLLGGGGYLAYRVARRWIRPYRTLDETARAVQRADDQAGRQSHSLTISALEFGERPAIPGSAALKNEVIQSAKTQPNDPARARLYSARHLQVARHMATAALIVAGLLALAGSRTTIFFLRMAGLPTHYPSTTQIVRVDWQRVVPAQVDYPVSVTVSGRVPASAMMTITPEKGRAFSLPMVAQSNNTFSAILQGPEQSFSFVCALGDATTEVLPVTVRKPPFVTNLVVAIQPPAYTGSPARQDPNATVSVPEGSELTFTLSTDLPLDTCALTGEGRLIPCSRTPAGAWTARSTFTNSWSYSVLMTTADKLNHTDPALRRLVVIPDNPPTVELHSPKPNSVAAPNSLLVYDFIARDDYALKDVWIYYEIFERRNDNDVRVKKGNLQMALPPGPSREMTIHQIKPAADLGLDAGQRIVFTVMATDNRQPVGQTVKSDQAPVTVVPPEELRRILDTGLKQSAELIRKISEDERRQSEVLHQRLEAKEKP